MKNRHSDIGPLLDGYPVHTSRQSHLAQVEALRLACMDKSLCLVLGSGISQAKPYDLPSWGALLRALMLDLRAEYTVESTHLGELLKVNPLVVARYLRREYAAGVPSNLEDAARRILYSNLRSKGAHSPTVEMIGDFAVRKYLHSVITYNYDDILEDFFAHLQAVKGRPIVDCQPLYTASARPTPGRLPVYHVHGYLPRHGDLTRDNEITLAEDNYHTEYHSPYSWRNLVQVNRFREQTCLFLGISLTDPNLRRLLDVARGEDASGGRTHFIVRKRNVPELLRIEVSLRLQRQRLEQPAERADDDAAEMTDEQVGKLAHRLDEFTEADDASLGLSTVWVDEFDDIPTLLDSFAPTPPSLAGVTSRSR